MSNNHKVTASAEPPRKGVRKVNLSDLQGSISKRGRKAFTDDELSSAMAEAFADGSPFIWETATITTDTPEAQATERAKWRARAKSVFDHLNLPNAKFSATWTNENEMVVIISK